jgi:hemoglobin-like flavoprotein
MSRSDTELVRDGFARLAPRLEPACLAFCARLFGLDVSLRALFPNDLHPLAASLATGLEMVVRSLDDFRPVLLRAPALGLRFASYGLEPMDLPAIGTAFLATLDAELGDALTGEARAAWLRVFWTIAIAAISADGRTLAAAA